MTSRIFLSSLAAGLVAVGLGVSAPVFAQETSNFERYEAFDEASTIRVDYSAMDDILGGMVFEVGRSDRMPGRGTAPVRTGTRVRLENNSRYRYEANRLVLHNLNGEHEQVIAEYRAELERLPSVIPLSSLSSNEQLAYWFNLHNIVVIDELAQRYPIRNLGRWRIDGVPYQDAKIIEVDGQQLSLNDIRFNIVGANWDDPRVMYGFFTGSVGGPTLQGEAFSGRRVWSALDANAREFVNALRGVEDARFGYRISPLYGDWREAVFPNWPEDVSAHLTSFAESAARQTVSADAEPHFLRFDASVADMTNGVGDCRGTGTFDVRVWAGEEGALPEYPCGQLPQHAQDFISIVIERRLDFLRAGELGSVTIRDIETDDGGNEVGRRIDLDGQPVDDDAS